MSYSIFISPTAEQETEDAVLYYEGISAGLGFAFLNEIENSYDSICQNPQAYSYIDNKKIIRDVAVKRFPFVIIYKVDADKVIIISVHQTQKKPRY